jgi:nitrogen fixation NifU-like protein
MKNSDPLYQDKILAFARLARTSKQLASPQYSGTANNPACGDKVRVDITLDESGYIQEIGAVAEGCALCEAGAGYLIKTAPRMHRGDLARLPGRITAWLKGESPEMVSKQQAAFTPVRDITARHKCVTLPFSAAAEALKDA